MVRRQTIVIGQAWEESERGWGVRSDGFTLHLSIEDYEAWVTDHYARHVGPAPDEYVRLREEPFAVSVNAAMITKLESAKRKRLHGLWIASFPKGTRRVQVPAA